jgi:hypothetical protein
MLMQQEWVAVFYKMLCISETNYTTGLQFTSICRKIPQGFKVKTLFLFFTFLSE